MYIIFINAIGKRKNPEEKKGKEKQKEVDLSFPLNPPMWSLIFVFMVSIHTGFI